MNRPTRCRLACRSRHGIIREWEAPGKLRWRCENCLAVWSYYETATSRRPILATLVVVVLALFMIGASR